MLASATMAASNRAPQTASPRTGDLGTVTRPAPCILARHRSFTAQKRRRIEAIRGWASHGELDGRYSFGGSSSTEGVPIALLN